MKRILFALLLLPFVSKGQSDFSLNGGALCNIPLQAKYKQYKPGINMYAGLKYQRYAKHHLLYGAEVSISKLSYTYIYDYTDINYRYLGRQKTKPYFGSPSIGLRLFAGNSFQMKHNTINAGLSIGGLYNTSPKENRSYPDKVYAANNYGYRLGFFFEYIYYFKRLGIGANIDMEYISMIDDYRDFVDNSIILPATIGIHYKL